MAFEDILPIIQIAISLLLIIAVLFQNRGTALSATFGGGDGVIKHTRRGFEKVLLWLTIILSVLFFVSAFASIIIE